MKKINLNKKAEIFGMSFSMIFSIILIVFFILVAFIGIRAFLNYQKSIQISLFITDFQGKIDEAWNCAGACNFRFNSTIPSSVNYICLIDFANVPKNAGNIEVELYDDIRKEGYSIDRNLYVYSEKEPIILKKATIKHVDMTKKNPICFKRTSGIISVKIDKKTENPLVEVSY